MELFHIFWDDQQKLFLEFQKSTEEKQYFLPEKIKRVNLQFEMSKMIKQEISYKQQPSLVSIKKIYHSNEYLSFSIDLDEIHGFDDIQIKIVNLIILLFSGERIEYSLAEKFNIADIEINEDCYVGFQYYDLRSNKNERKTITKEKLFQKVSKDINNKEKKTTLIYKKNSVETISVDQSIISMIGESNKTLKNIEMHIKNLNMTLQNMPLNVLSSGVSSSVPKRISGPGIERINKSPPSSLIQNQGSSSKLLVIKEMKTIFRETTEKNNGFSIKDILKPMSEEELNNITLDENKLLEKEEEAIQNQIKRLKKQEEQKLSLDYLKKPE